MNVLNKKFLLENSPNWQEESSLENLLQLPEKVIQFGTGVLLRGLPDYIIDQANKQGVFNGRIVVVKSTSHGNTDAFKAQDCLYTVCIRGIEGGKVIEKEVICTSISRVLEANQEWAQILACAENPHISIVLSNTTEVGIQLVQESIFAGVPDSFPGKLLAYLHHRFQFFKGTPESGMTIIPTELISDNGKKLENILLELAHLNHLDTAFIDWLESNTVFCNSLVDRIVPGSPKGQMGEQLKEKLPYHDALCITSEPYALWAIEGNDTVNEKLSFCRVNEGAFVTPSIEKSKELKLRLLNGTHSLTCAIAHLSGFVTVKEAMENSDFQTFTENLLFEELIPALPEYIREEEANQFGRQVIDRFKNPFIDHQWLSIAQNYTQKLEMRALPLLYQTYENRQELPALFVYGLAAYIRFMKTTTTDTANYEGEMGNKTYPVQDRQAVHWAHIWTSSIDLQEVIQKSLQYKDFWGGQDLSMLHGLVSLLTIYLEDIERQLTTQGKIDLKFMTERIN